MELKVITIGNSLGVVIPKNTIEAKRIKKGQLLEINIKTIKEVK